MTGTKGAIGKDKQLPELAMSEEERLGLLVELILETVTAEEPEEVCQPN